jgi:hypothetical protein
MVGKRNQYSRSGNWGEIVGLPGARAGSGIRRALLGRAARAQSPEVRGGGPTSARPAPLTQGQLTDGFSATLSQPGLRMSNSSYAVITSRIGSCWVNICSGLTTPDSTIASSFGM